MPYLPPQVKDESRKRYGKLRVVDFEGIHPKSGKAMWRCKCD